MEYVLTIMSRKSLLMLLISIACSIHATAQEDYYYYNGKKIPLTQNENTVIVSIPKDCGDITESIVAKVEDLLTIKDGTFDIFIITRQDFDKLTSMDSWEEYAKSVILTSSYFTEGNEEVFATPYLNVRLKKEEDADLLASYAEKYRLKIVGILSQFFPLWYILHITSDSDKNTLTCANELWESGYFAASVPDFAASAMLYVPDATNVRSFTTPTAEGSPGIFDLNGRKQISIPIGGIYVHRGRKVLAK